MRGALAVPVFGGGASRGTRVEVPELGLSAPAVAMPGGRFYAFLDVPAVPTPRVLEVRAGQATAELRCEPYAPAAEPIVDADVVVCMATYEPAPELLARQLESLRAQTHADWRCVIRDDGSSPATLEAIRALAAADDRFVVVASGGNAGFYRNFERALEHVGRGTRFVALADQDDRWHPDKLAVLVDALERSGAQIAYSDSRIVDARGRVLGDSFYAPRRNNPDDLRALLLANAAPGASMLMRRELLDRALPFPVPFGQAFHDHWLAVLALAGGGLEYVARPLWDYVQHGANVAGHQSAQTEARRSWAGRYAAVYDQDVMRLLSLAGTLELRAGADAAPDARAAIGALRGIERDRRAQAALVVHGLRARAARAGAPTGAIELDLALALAWRRLGRVRERRDRTGVPG